MTKTIDMRLMRYLNLFERISRTRPVHCFEYCGNIVFIVNKIDVSRAIGENGKNVKRISEIMEKRIRIISKPEDSCDIENFILTMIHPARFRGIEIKPDEVVVNAGPQCKALLIGRDKKRLIEMQSIIKEFFNKGFRVI